MKPSLPGRVLVFLLLLLGAGVAAAAAAIVTGGGSGTGCATGRWPATAAGRPAAKDAPAIWTARDVWHLRAGGAGVVSGKISGRAKLKLLAASRRSGDRIAVGPRSVVFRFTHGALSSAAFSSGCARSLRFDVRPGRTGTRITLGAAGHAPASTFSLSRPASTGVRGRTVLGPSCPVVQVGVPCPSKPVKATVKISSVTATKGGGTTPLASVPTDADGNFSTDLGPGRYMLAPESTSTQGAGKPTVVLVEHGVVTIVTLQIDSRIR